jgi:hypothetical protein
MQSVDLATPPAHDTETATLLHVPTRRFRCRSSARAHGDLHPAKHTFQ